ncbi:MAG TPA: DUF1656 domain-containing protein [Rhodanobacteraceae bacterium]
MPRELSVGGMFMPSLLLVFVVALGLLALLDWVAGRYGWYRHVWHPALFRLAVFVGVFAALGLAAMRGD